MKIAVTSQNFRTVTSHAGRARRFIIFEAEAGSEAREIERLDLPKEMAIHDFHGTGPHPLDAVDVVLSESFGQGFAQRMTQRGVIAAIAAAEDPKEAAEAYAAAAALAPDGPAPVVGNCGSHHGHAGTDGHHQHGHHHHHGHGHGHGHGHTDGCGSE